MNGGSSLGSSTKPKGGLRGRESPALSPFAGLARKKVIVIAGPTAIGKTSLSLVIARALGGEVISADSMQVYRGMDIGTAKPSWKEREGVVHHLIDSRDLDESINVCDYAKEASDAIREILDRGAVPLIVGGSGFYLDAILYGPPGGPASDPAIRSRLESEMELFGIDVLFKRLSDLDPEYARTITPNDRHKVIRALEIMQLSQKPVSFFSFSPSYPSQQYDFRCWFLAMDREALYAAIETRCDEMLRSGFIEEVEKLDKQGLRLNRTASRAIGYKQCLEFLDTARTEKDKQEFIARFKQASRNYAKRQFTWFKQAEGFRWLDRNTLSLEQIAEIIIQDYERGCFSSSER